jgi:hypothetical protein
MKVILNTVINLPLDHYPYRHDSMVPNTVTQFYGTDSQQLFEHNLKYRTNWIYSDKEVTYHFNSDGLRMKKNLTEIDDNYIMFSGTSHTFAIGLSEEDRFSNTVAKELNLDFVNCSSPLNSIKTQTINFFNLINSGYKLPKIFVLEYPPCEVYSFYTNDNFVLFYRKHMPDETYSEYINLYDKMKNLDFLYQEAITYQNMIRSVCKRLNIKLIEIGIERDDIFTEQHVPNLINVNINSDDINFCYARDYRLVGDRYIGHPGIGIHKNVHDIILESL